MQVTKMEPVTYEATAIQCVLAVRYEEEDMPNDYPHRSGDTWNITIDIDTGMIRDWPEGVEPRELNMNVFDEGTYSLLAVKEPNGPEFVLAKLVNEYVPNCLPNDYGDYITFDIDGNGVITNWRTDAGEVEAAFLREQ